MDALSIAEAKALLSSMMKEELQAAMESAKQDESKAMLLRFTIAKAEKGHLVDASIIAEAKSLLPATRELKAAMTTAQEDKNLAVFATVISKAKMEQLVYVSAISEAETTLEALETEKLRADLQSAK